MKPKTIEANELEASIHEVLREVERGQIIEVIRQGKVVARVIPVRRAQKQRLHRDENDAWARLNALIDEISADWPEGVSAQDAVRDVRNYLGISVCTIFHLTWNGIVYLG